MKFINRSPDSSKDLKIPPAHQTNRQSLGRRTFYNHSGRKGQVLRRYPQGDQSRLGAAEVEVGNEITNAPRIHEESASSKRYLNPGSGLVGNIHAGRHAAELHWHTDSLYGRRCPYECDSPNHGGEAGAYAGLLNLA